MGSNSMPTSCCTVQVRNPRQADSSHTLSTQITPTKADERRRCWRPRRAATLHHSQLHIMPYTPVFAHITQLRSPPRNPARCEFLQDARTSVRTPHMRCCWLCRVRCAATDWAAPAAAPSAQPVWQRRPLRRSRRRQASARLHARCHHVVKVAVSCHLPDCISLCARHDRSPSGRMSSGWTWTARLPMQPPCVPCQCTKRGAAPRKRPAHGQTHRVAGWVMSSGARATATVATAPLQGPGRRKSQM